MNTQNIDFDKFVKYSKPGPRYTSYPTAPEFSESFTEQTYINILKNQDKNRKISLYIHLPFCRSVCYFCGCNVIFTSKEEKKERYITYLEYELKILSKYIDNSREVLQLHFGGGTPTFFSAEQLDRIIKLIKKYFKYFTNDAEISCEIDPRFLNQEQTNILAGHGFNRVSFGVQDFDEKVQKTIHRIQTFDTTNSAIKMVRKAGIKSVNMDLIYGLPYQTNETFKNTLKMALRLDTDRFAVFNYAHVPWMKKTMRKIDETTLPHPSEKLTILKYTIDYLTSNGLKMIGMDHFAKPNDELFLAIQKGELHRNFQGYTTKGGADLIGVGLTSIGDGANHYVQNVKEMKEYERLLDKGCLPVHRGLILSDDDILRKAVIMEMMSNFKLNIVNIEHKFSIVFVDYFANELEKLKVFEKDGLIKINKEKIVVNSTGILLIRNIVMPFDAYLQKNLESKSIFSKTV